MIASKNDDPHPTTYPNNDDPLHLAKVQGKDRYVVYRGEVAMGHVTKVGDLSKWVASLDDVTIRDNQALNTPQQSPLYNTPAAALAWATGFLAGVRRGEPK